VSVQQRSRPVLTAVEDPNGIHVVAADGRVGVVRGPADTGRVHVAFDDATVERVAVSQLTVDWTRYYRRPEDAPAPVKPYLTAIHGLTAAALTDIDQVASAAPSPGGITVLLTPTTTDEGVVEPVVEQAAGYAAWSTGSVADHSRVHLRPTVAVDGAHDA
jgi:hypothetical protein